MLLYLELASTHRVAEGHRGPDELSDRTPRLAPSSVLADARHESSAFGPSTLRSSTKVGQPPHPRGSRRGPSPSLALASLLLLSLTACSDDSGTDPGDTAPPAPVTDLAIGDAGDRTVQLTWTSPETSGEDPATAYDIRYGTQLLTEANFAQAMSAADPPTPAAAGTAESFNVSGLEPAAQYFFALRASVQPSNWSAVSNVAQASTDNLVRLTTSFGYPGSHSPDWSPDGTRIVYAFGSYPSTQSPLFWKPVAGDAALQLTSGETIHANPSWSPDGSQIAYASEFAGNFDIWVLSANGGDRIRVTSDVADEHSPTWSPDARAIGFVRDGRASQDIWLAYLE